MSHGTVLGSIAAALLIAGLTALPQPAAAHWDSTVERDDFGSDHVGIAATMSDARGLVLRCENKSEPRLIFGTRELWDASLALLPATLLVKVDDGEPWSRQAVLDEYPMMVGLGQQSGTRVVVTGDDLFPVLEAIAKGKSRIAIAVQIGDKRFENTRFSARGSRAAFKRIWEFCGSDSNIKPNL